MLSEKTDEISNQIALAKQQARNDYTRYRDRQAILQEERATIVRQRTMVVDRIDLANDILVRYLELRDFEAASDLDVIRQQENLSFLRQEQARIDQDERRITAEILDVEAQLAAIPLQQEKVVSDLHQELSSIENERNQYEQNRQTLLESPVNGLISSLNVKDGMSVSEGMTIATILPDGGRIEAELFIPSRAAGLLQVGQETSVVVDAFPHQRFGFISGELTRISKNVFGAQDLPYGDIDEGTFYRATVQLRSSTVQIDGQAFDLQVGMTVQANIIQERRYFYDIVLDPLQKLWRK